MRPLFLFIFLLPLTCLAQPADQPFFTSDIDRFWEAYDSIQSTQDTTTQTAIFQELYLNQASPGLIDLMDVRNYSIEEYMRAIRNYPQFWSSIRDNTLRVQEQFPVISSSIAKFKEWYPGLDPKPIYFAFGVFRSNGTISRYEDKVLISAEMALAGKNVVAEEMPDHPRQFFEKFHPWEDLPLLCTHEYVHTQQQPIAHELLLYCLYEGIAERIATLVTDSPSYLPAIHFESENTDTIRSLFQKDMFYPSRTYDWLWSDKPVLGFRDMGYAVGNRMAELFIQNSSDKKEAIRQLIELDFHNQKEVDALINATGYFDQPVEDIRKEFWDNCPYVKKITGLENGAKNVPLGPKTVTIHFSEPLNGQSTGVDFGPDESAEFPYIMGERVWSTDQKSWTINLDVVPNKHYQLLITSNFRKENDRPLQPYLIEFWTVEK